MSLSSEMSGIDPPPPDGGQRNLLVTGAHRSGTTWTASVLARAPDVVLVDEPFNPIYNPRRVRRPFPHWFEYVTDANEERKWRQRVELDAVFSYGYPHGQLVNLRSRAEAKRYLVEVGQTAAARRRRHRIVCKDPIAVFSVPWLARRYHCDVVACIRHPAGFASSLQRLGWSFDFTNWTSQADFMEDCAGPYADDIERFAARERSPLDQAVLLWNVIYRRVAEYRREHPEWSFVRHEDLSAEPVGEFRELYARHGLGFGRGAERFLRRSTSASNPADVHPDRYKTVFRDSREASRAWVGRLEPDEVRRIRAATEEVSAAFYGPGDWPAP